MNNLRQIRKSRKLTMKQLGEMVGVTESMIGQIETYRRNPSFELLLKLGEALNCSVDDIVSDKKIPVTDCDEDERILLEKHLLVNNLFDQLSPDDQAFAIDFLKKLSQSR